MDTNSGRVSLDFISFYLEKSSEEQLEENLTHYSEDNEVQQITGFLVTEDTAETNERTAEPVSSQANLLTLFHQMKKVLARRPRLLRLYRKLRPVHPILNVHSVQLFLIFFALFQTGFVFVVLIVFAVCLWYLVYYSPLSPFVSEDIVCSRKVENDSQKSPRKKYVQFQANKAKWNFQFIFLTNICIFQNSWGWVWSKIKFFSSVTRIFINFFIFDIAGTVTSAPPFGTISAFV